MSTLEPTDIGLAFHSEIVDRLTAQVSQWLGAREIGHVLLKGPTIARWLYDRDELRSYGDTDIMVGVHRWDEVVALLREHGFRDALEAMAHPRMESFTSHPWESPMGDVDLHATLSGLQAPPDQVWAALSRESTIMTVAGVDVPVLGIPARLLHIGLHASQHQSGWAISDLERALARAEESDWATAAELARELGGEAAFANGLAMRPEGRAILQRVGLANAKSVETLLRSGSVPLAESLYELGRTPGVRAKLTLAAREVVPTPEFMRWWSPLARRGRRGLVATYAWRPLYLLGRLPAGLWAIRSAKRRTRP